MFLYIWNYILVKRFKTELMMYSLLLTSLLPAQFFRIGRMLFVDLYVLVNICESSSRIDQWVFTVCHALSYIHAEIQGNITKPHDLKKTRNCSPNTIIGNVRRFQEKSEKRYLIQIQVTMTNSKGMWRGQGTFAREGS